MYVNVDDLELELTHLKLKLMRLEDEARTTKQQIHEVEQAKIERVRDARSSIVESQGERCPACDAWLRSSSSYWAMRNKEDHPGPVYHQRAKYQIRLDVPESRGGKDELDNLVAYCVTCAQRKGVLTHDEYMSKLGRDIDVFADDEDGRMRFERAIGS